MSKTFRVIPKSGEPLDIKATSVGIPSMGPITLYDTNEPVAVISLAEVVAVVDVSAIVAPEKT